MGCTNSTRKQETDVGRYKHDEKKFQNLFHATTEFDISTSDSENEHVILSMKSINKNNYNNKDKLTKKIDKLSSGLTTTNNNSSTASSSTLIGNRLTKTYV
ncbi:unnamed protein product [Rotaria sordida]|uniref:Uncharacterized protein n=1 Tax=Rotaria sordida TaxID=392033 RepID=A0A819B4N2_9BILA|nr:unnamed protein product [Rotaria sordida]CAF1110044.1 unnamed protein product [Rotaria sordida]CAF1256424.1 unnamed protein product [Rotaria sordida]CAF1305275.1 unnamed protein product [Rotaria sordida]CAF1521604.1 unnamed protein product [Rotaria sordida]